MNQNTSPHRIRQRGTITQEAILAIVMATAVIVGTAQTLAILAHQRREVDQRSVAMREAGNLSEEIAATSWRDLTEENLSTFELSDECQQVLRDPLLIIKVVPESDGAGKHILVEIDWLTGQQERSLPMRLALWRYPNEEPER